MSEEHVWQVGQLCTCAYNDVGPGILYRVTAVTQNTKFWGGTSILKLTPILGMLSPDFKGRRKRSLSSAHCQPQSLIDLASEYAKLGVFISDEAKRRSE